MQVVRDAGLKVPDSTFETARRALIRSTVGQRRNGLMEEPMKEHW